MSEQPKQGDRKILKNQIHIHDGKKWQDRGHADDEGMSNLLHEIHSGKTDLSPQPIGTDGNGNPIYRLKKYMPK